jgi:hypothetical protein
MQKVTSSALFETNVRPKRPHFHARLAFEIAATHRIQDGYDGRFHVVREGQLNKRKKKHSHNLNAREEGYLPIYPSSTLEQRLAGLGASAQLFRY